LEEAVDLSSDRLLMMMILNSFPGGMMSINLVTVVTVITMVTPTVNKLPRVTMVTTFWYRSLLSFPSHRCARSQCCYFGEQKTKNQKCEVASSGKVYKVSQESVQNFLC
jgi:hypothetical protein